MRIVSRLRIIAGGSMAALVLLAIALGGSLRVARQAQNDHDLADEIKICFLERTSLRDQYFLYREERTRALWFQNKETSDHLLRQADTQFLAEECRVILPKLHRSIESTVSLFQRLVDTTAMLQAANSNQVVFQELKNRLSSQLLLKATEVSDASTALQDVTERRVVQANRRLTFILGLFAVSLSLATILTILQITSLIRKKLAPLHVGLNKVASGDLGFRLRRAGTDEFSELALVINDMADKLQEQTHALRESEEAFRTVADYTYDWELWEDPGGAILYCSPSCERITSYPPDAFRADPALTTLLVHPEDRTNWQAHREIVHASTGPEAGAVRNGDELEFRLLRPDGEVRWIGHICHPIHNAAGHFLGHRISNRDTTARKQAESDLHHSEQKFRTLFEHLSEGVALHELVMDDAEAVVDYRLLDVNPAYETHTGLAAASAPGRLGTELYGTEVPPYLAEFSRVALGGEPYTFETNFPPLDKHFRISVISPKAGQFATVFQDITEHKKLETQRAELEAQKAQFQKAESLGLMAGSIAHHFNNKLQTVMANLEVLSALPKAGDPTKYLAMAKLASEKAAAVSRQMLVYLGNTPGERRPLALGEFCAVSLPLLQQALPSGVTLESACPASGPVSKANAEQLEQVLTNLLTNAGEAMGAAGGGVRLSLSTCPAAEVPTAHRFPIGWQPQGPDYACLEVADTGVGIASADIEKLFDPFFSTKFTGRGLGLSVVLGLVQAHGGVITVESTQGRGSVFRVYLPVSTEEVPSLPERAVQAPEHEGGGTLLLVDDDEMLLMSTGALVDILGFTMLTAKDGVEALEVFRQHQAEIRCVVTDLTMPRLDGWGLLTALRQLDPNLPVILASGYDKAQVLAGNHSDRPQAFLSKPFDLEQLRDAVGRALTAGPTANAN